MKNKTFIMCLFPNAYNYLDVLLNDIDASPSAKILKVYKCKLNESHSWEMFMLNYYYFSKHRKERYKISRESIIKKAREMNDQSIVQIEIEVSNPVFLNTNKYLGDCVPKTLDEIKCNFREKCMKEDKEIKKYNIAHLFDSSLYNQDIVNFVNRHCKISSIKHKNTRGENE